MNITEINKKSKLIYESSGEIKKKAKEYFIECSKKYFLEYYEKFPIPPIKVQKGFFEKEHAAAKYKCTYNTHNFEIVRQEIIIDEELSGDFDELKRFIFHETIHYYDSWVNPYSHFVLDSKVGGHGPYFIKMMNKINNREGRNFISIEAKFTDNKSKSLKDFYIYIIKNKNGVLFATINPKREIDIINNLLKITNEASAKLYIVKTNILSLKMLPSTDKNKTNLSKIYSSENYELLSTIKELLNSPNIEEIKNFEKKLFSKISGFFTQ